MALTGLWYSFDWYRTGAIWLLSRPSDVAKPMQPKSPRAAGTAKAKPESDAESLALDRAWSTFLHEQGRRFTTAQLTLPAGAGTVIRIRSWAQDASLDGPREVNDELWELVEPAIRADLAAAELGRYTPDPLDVPVVAIRGRHDHIISIGNTRRWAECTSAGFELVELDCGHAILDTRPGELARELARLACGCR